MKPSYIFWMLLSTICTYGIVVAIPEPSQAWPGGWSPPKIPIPPIPMPTIPPIPKPHIPNPFGRRVPSESQGCLSVYTDEYYTFSISNKMEGTTASYRINGENFKLGYGDSRPHKYRKAYGTDGCNVTKYPPPTLTFDSSLSHGWQEKNYPVGKDLTKYFFVRQDETIKLVNHWSAAEYQKSPENNQPSQPKTQTPKIVPSQSPSLQTGLYKIPPYNATTSQVPFVTPTPVPPLALPPAPPPAPPFPNPLNILAEGLGQKIGETIARAISPSHKYAAIAYSNSTGKMAWSWNINNSQVAENSAIKGCGVSDCKTFVFADSFGAFVKASDGGGGWSTGNTQEQASQSALSICKNNTNLPETCTLLLVVHSESGTLLQR